MKQSIKIIALIFLAVLGSACDNGGTGQPAASDAEKKAVPSQEPVWVPSWRKGPDLAIQRSGAAIVEANGVIHVIGGVDGKDFLTSTEYARVQPDGSLSPWQKGTSLNIERGFFAAAVHGNFVYAVGGGRGEYGKILLDTAERAEILPDGTLGEWVVEKSILNIERRCSKLMVVGDHLYTFGGFGGILLDTVERAEFLPDGSLDEWLMLSDNMMVPRYIHGVERAGDVVYVVGGHDKEKGVGIQNVEWSRDDEEGFLQPWQSSTPMAMGRYGLATFIHGDYLYAVGGLDGAAYLDSAEKSRILGDGGLSPWGGTTPLTSRREGMAAVTVGDFVYLIGGTNLGGFKRTVEYATFNDQGDMGYWGTAEELRAAERALSERKEKMRVLPNEATVAQHIKASRYSYVGVRRDDGLSAWLAGPVMDLKPGDRVQFPDGVVMSNFYSKELSQNFPTVMFVGEIRVVTAVEQ